jgi:hypothetical protein
MTRTVTIDQDRAGDLGGRDYLGTFVGLRAVYTTWEGERLVGTVESLTGEQGQPWGLPIIRFADGRWARGNSTLEIVED